jgi:broad specificity phosphatase PhoE
MTTLALMRHAETSWSIEKRIQGRTDVPLSDAGRERLRKLVLPRECRHHRFLSSPLVRCTETAAALGLANVTLDERLAEMRWGLWEGRRLEELREELGAEMLQNEERGFDFTPPRGESPRDVLQRVSELLFELATEGQPALAMTHRGVIRVVFAAACGWDMRGRPPMKLDWEAVHLFQLDRTGRPSILRMNVPLEVGSHSVMSA